MSVAPSECARNTGNASGFRLTVADTTAIFLAQTCLEAALAYAAAGLPVFPLHPPRDGACTCGKPGCTDAGKHPMTAHGCHDATTDEQQIRTWWRVWPTANLGLHCVGLLVIDEDGPEGAQVIRDLEAVHSPLPPTLTQRTRQGRHLIYFLPPGRKARNRVRIDGKDVDARTDGGYIVLAPSRHVSGHVYSYERIGELGDLVEAPGWLIDWVAPPVADRELPPIPVVEVTSAHRDYALAELTYREQDISCAGQGKRHERIRSAALWMGGIIASGAIDRETVEARLVRAGVATGKDQGEVERVVEWGIEAGTERPLPLPAAPPPTLSGGMSSSASPPPSIVVEPAASTPASPAIDPPIGSVSASASSNMPAGEEVIGQYRVRIEQGPDGPRAAAVPLDVAAHYLSDLRPVVEELVRRYPGLQALLTILSPLDSGKTTQIAALIKGLKRVLSVAVRRALSRNQSLRFGLVNYQDVETRTISDPLLTCQLDSLDRVALDTDDGRWVGRWDSMILDEADQLVRHLAARTMRRRSHRALERLQAHVRLAQVIVLADAHLTSLSVDLVREMLRGAIPGQPRRWLEVVVKKPLAECHRRHWMIFKQRADLYADIMFALHQGLSLAIATNSRAQARRLTERIRKQFPTISVGVFTSETAFERAEEIKMFGTPAEPEYGILVYTPTLGTGVSVDVKDHYDRVYLLFGPGAGTVHDGLQAAHRVRSPTDRTIRAWVDPQVSERETDPGVIREAVTSLRALEEGLLVTILDPRTHPTPAAAPLDDLHSRTYCRIKAHNHRWTNALRIDLVKILREDGCEVTSHTMSEKAQLMAKKMMAEDREADDTKYATSMREATIIPKTESDRIIDEGPDPGDPDQVAEQLRSAQASRIAYRYGPEVWQERETILSDRERGWPRVLAAIDDRVHRLSRDELTAERDYRDACGPDGLVTAEARRDLTSAGLRAEVIRLYGIDDPWTHEGDVPGIVEDRKAEIEVVKQELEEQLGITVQSDFRSRPFVLLAAALRKIGLGLDDRQDRIGKKRVTKYTVDSGMRKAMLRLMDHAYRRALGEAVSEVPELQFGRTYDQQWAAEVYEHIYGAEGDLSGEAEAPHTTGSVQAAEAGAPASRSSEGAAHAPGAAS